MVKANAVTKGYELDTFLSKGKDSVLNVLFSGGVIRGKKLQRGSVYLFSDVNETETKEKSDAPSHEQLIKTYDTVYLLKWLCPPQELLSDHLILGGTKRFPLFH